MVSCELWQATQSVELEPALGGRANAAWKGCVFAVSSWQLRQSTGATRPWLGRAFASTPSWQSVQPRDP
jgi:hypothetical protein